jgi:hypothetical protein
VLQSLEAEKERRREALIAAGKLIVLSVTRIVSQGCSEQSGDLKAVKDTVLAEHLAKHLGDRGKAVEWKVVTIISAWSEKIGFKTRRLQQVALA